MAKPPEILTSRQIARCTVPMTGRAVGEGAWHGKASCKNQGCTPSPTSLKLAGLKRRKQGGESDAVIPVRLACTLQLLFASTLPMLFEILPLIRLRCDESEQRF